jgi:membrane protease YdiL (CAAX protease family)
MTQERKSKVAIFLVGLPVLSNIVSFIFFAPLFAPGKTATPSEFQRANVLLGIAILVIEVISVLLIVLLLRRDNASIKNIINFQSNKIQSYLITGLIALLPTLAAGWFYGLGQAQAGVESNLEQLTSGEIILWYIFTPFVAAFLEETIWRGYALSHSKSTWWSLLFTSLSFALFHGIFNPLAVVATFVQGLVWGWVYYRTQSTIPSMVLHFVSRYLALFF